jgi:hypothetical protein
MKMARAVLAIISSVVALFLALPIILLGVPFCMVALLTRLCTRLLRPKCVPLNQLMEFDPTVSWKPKANLNTHYFAVDGEVCHIRTDAQGWASKTSLSQSEVVVFGDSFAFGYGVNFAASFVELSRHLRIKAIGAPGYNMVQELLLMRQLALQLRDKLVVWLICLDNDLYDNLRPSKVDNTRAPFVRHLKGGDDWEIVTSHINPTKWYCSSVDGQDYYPMLATLCTPSFFSQRAFSACEFLIRQGKDICRKVNAQLVVLTVPNRNQLSKCGHDFLASYLEDAKSFDPDFPDKRISEICRTLEIGFQPAKQYLEASDYKESDPHWNERGHRHIAELLYHIHRSYVSGDRK